MMAPQFHNLKVGDFAIISDRIIKRVYINPIIIRENYVAHCITPNLKYIRQTNQSKEYKEYRLWSMQSRYKLTPIKDLFSFVDRIKIEYEDTNNKEFYREALEWFSEQPIVPT